MAEDKPDLGPGISKAPHIRPELPESPAQALEPKAAPQYDASADTSHPTPNGRRSRAMTRALNSLAALFMLLVLAVAGVLTYAKFRFEAMGPLTAPAAITIAPGSGVGAIADQLEEAGIIDNALIFEGGIRLHGTGGRLKAGEYAFPKGASMRTVMTILVDGKAILHKITLPEGWTSQQMLARINADTVLTGEPVDVPEEGVLLPETYRFTRGLSRKAFVDQMKSAQKALLDKLWDKRDASLPYKTRLEALTLASIVEKETGVSSERAHIAGVFVNRLRKGMRLQSDPTVIYGLVGGKGRLDHPIRISDLNSDTPYNTYKIKALPPGPIANPGAAAIRAALNPLTTKDLYFVADGSGGHAFAEDLAGHRKNVLKWRKIEQQRKKAKANQLPSGAQQPGGEQQPTGVQQPTLSPAPKGGGKPATPPTPEAGGNEASSGSVKVESKPLVLPGAPAKP